MGGDWLAAFGKQVPEGQRIGESREVADLLKLGTRTARVVAEGPDAAAACASIEEDPAPSRRAEPRPDAGFCC